MAEQSSGIPSRRSVLAGLVAGSIAGGGHPARAQGLAAPAIGKNVTLTVSLWGGITEDSVRKFVAPEFERATGAKLAYDIGGQGARVTKLLAQRGNAPFDVIFTTDEAVITGYEAGVLAPVRRKLVPNAADIYDIAHTVRDHDTPEFLTAVPYTILSSVIVYNPNLISAPPTSYADLWRPEFKGKLSLSTPSGSTMPAFIINVAEMNGGSATNPDIAFEKLKELRPARLSVFWTDYAPLVKTGEIVIATDIDYYAESMKQQGYPIDYVVPKERSPAIPEYISLLKGSRNEELACAFINAMLDPKAQAAFARETFQGAVNKAVELSPAEAARCACGSKVSNLRFFDPKFIASVRPEWTERLTTEVLPSWKT